MKRALRLPAELAAAVAVAMVRAFVAQEPALAEALFVCFTAWDLAAYEAVLGPACAGCLAHTGVWRCPNMNSSRRGWRGVEYLEYAQRPSHTSCCPRASP